jgi:hypothetical protein
MKSSLQNPFADEWRECLLAHYRHILQCQEHKVEATLRQLLTSVGIDDERLIALGAPAPEEPVREPVRASALEQLSEASASEPVQEPEQPPAPEPTSEPTVQAPPAAPAVREKKPPKQLSFF